MRLKPNHIYLIIGAVLVSASLTFAQESGSPVLEGMEPEKSSGNSGEIIYIDGEGSAQRIQPVTINPPATVAPSTVQPQPVQRESTSVNRNTSSQQKAKSAPQKPDETEAKPEDSVLGFNFLYYIFQKYKMSDIIDWSSLHFLPDKELFKLLQLKDSFVISFPEDDSKNTHIV